MDEAIELPLGLRAFHDLRCAGWDESAVHAHGWGFAGRDVRYGGGVQEPSLTTRQSRKVEAMKPRTPVKKWTFEEVARIDLTRTVAWNATHLGRSHDSVYSMMRRMYETLGKARDEMGVAA